MRRFRQRFEFEGLSLVADGGAVHVVCCGHAVRFGEGLGLCVGCRGDGVIYAAEPLEVGVECATPESTVCLATLGGVRRLYHRFN